MSSTLSVVDEQPVRVLGRGLRASRGVRLTLRTVRDAVGVTQVELARESRIDQSDISRLENRSDFDECQLATIRRYIEALGGDLQLVARFGEKSIVLVGATPSAPSRDASPSMNGAQVCAEGTPPLFGAPRESR